MRIYVFISLLLIVLLAGCGADETTNSEDGAKAVAKQIVTTMIGKNNGSDVEKTVKVKFLDVDCSKDKCLFTGDAYYKVKRNGTEKIVETKMRFKLSLKYYGGVWNVKHKIFWDNFKEG
jgi:hypothetical protein